jgi:hypothetical protein
MTGPFIVIGFAVATLSDAQAYTSGLLSSLIDYREDPRGAQTAATWLWSLPESGGSISLPDGSEIVVEATEWRELVAAVEPGEGIPAAGSAGARWPTPEQKVAILAAYNAGQLATLRATHSPWPLSASAIRRSAGLSSVESAQRHLRVLVAAGLVRKSWAGADRCYVYMLTVAGRERLREDAAQEAGR